MMKKTAVACLGSAAIVLASAGAASAGEVTGNGKDTPIRGGVANSVCAFSGLNNDVVVPGEPVEPGRTQSYGQIVRSGGKAFAPSPGVACNPTRGLGG